MLLGLLVASLAFQAPARIVEVSRGLTIPSASGSASAFTYWDTEDTTLDGTDQDAGRGGEATLVGAPSTVILIRFGDLDRVLGSTRHIRKATLHLIEAAGDKPELGSVSQLLRPWGEGPLQSMTATIARLGQATAPGEKAIKQAPPKMAATWRARQFGADNGNWQQPGAKGPSDSKPVANVQLVQEAKDVEIQGLGPILQWEADHPSENFGIALAFTNSCEFFSAQAVNSRPRLELELDPSPRPTGPDLSVTSIEKTGQGEFVAHIKNVGDAPAQGFNFSWSLNGRDGSVVEHTETTAPGAVIDLSVHEAPKADPSDHRSGTIGFSIEPKGPDARSANDALTVYSEAKQIAFVADPSDFSAASANGVLGGVCFEDWVQSQLRIFNDVYLAQSRFSFAPDGCKERVAARSIRLSSEHSDSDGATIRVTAQMFVPYGESRPLFKAIGKALGLADLSIMNIPARGGRVSLPGAADRGTEDLYGGLMGGGDTRFDGALPGALNMPYEPKFTPDDQQPDPEAPGLLSMTDVFELNARVGADGAAGLPASAPKAVLIRVKDLLDRPLSGVPLSFYQSHDGKIGNDPPAFQAKLSDSGIVLLPAREGGGIFGKLDPSGSNGLLLVKGESNGVSEWAWIKAWQVIDSYARGNLSAAILDLTLDLPGSPLDETRNLALQKFVTDSTGQGADRLAALVDGDPKTAVTLGEKVGDWVEVDLGRDRSLAEIRLNALPDRFWQSFDIVLYGTGQRPQDGLVFARERNWRLSRNNRSDGTGDAASVAYRGLPLQVRYIRIVSRSGGHAEICEISVTPAKIGN